MMGVAGMGVSYNYKILYTKLGGHVECDMAGTESGHVILLLRERKGPDDIYHEVST